MRRFVRIVAVATGVMAVLAGSACTALSESTRYPLNYAAPGHFEYLASDGSSTWGGGGPITAALSTLTCAPTAGCQSNRAVSGHFDTGAGFTGDPGRYSFRIVKHCEWRTYQPSPYLGTVKWCETTDIVLEELRTPDGTDSIGGIVAATNTSGCLNFDGTSPLASDPTVEVTIDLSMCNDDLMYELHPEDPASGPPL
jgi:hypothetical protein